MWGLLKFWRKKEVKPPCFHEYKLMDVASVTTNLHVEVVCDDRFILCCVNCNQQVVKDEYEYYKMQRHGLLVGGNE